MFEIPPLGSISDVRLQIYSFNSPELIVTVSNRLVLLVGGGGATAPTGRCCCCGVCCCEGEG